jgi:lipopolysaccharide heptosyltransferase II
MLCVRLDSLGDVLMCTPALRALRAAVPGRTITLLGSAAGAAAAPFIPEIDAVIAYEAPWMKAGAACAAAAPGEAIIAQLAASRFDAAVILTTCTQSALPAALLCHLAGIPLRLAHCRENPYALLTDWVPEPESPSCMRHEVQRQLALVRCVTPEPAPAGALSFVPRPADVTGARARLRTAGVDPDRPFLLLHPGASAPSRRYPAHHWARLLALLHERLSLPMVLAGSPLEAALVDDIRSRIAVPTISLAGQLGLGELGAVLALAAAAIVNNSGPAHIAAAVGTPVVVLYALTNPQHTPWHVRSRVLFHDVPCRFCLKSICPAGHQACLDGVAPERAADAVGELLRPPQRTRVIAWCEPEDRGNAAVARDAAPQ